MRANDEPTNYDAIRENDEIEARIVMKVIAQEEFEGGRPHRGRSRDHLPLAEDQEFLA